MTRPGSVPVSMRERLQTDYRWTPRQQEVLSMLAQGKSNAEIATTLDISLQGAKWHVSEVMSKLQADTREEAADYWRRYNGLVPRFARVFRGVVSLSAFKWLGTVVLGAVVAAAGIAIAVVASGDGGDPPVPSITLTPAAPAPVPSISEARASIEAADPPVARLIEATLQSDVDALTVAFPVSEGPCEEFVVRGLTRCESAGLPAGTQIRLYEIASEHLPGYRVDGEAVGDTVAYLLDGRNPRLDLITRRDDGAYVVVIGIEPKPDRIFPGGEISGGDVGTIWMTVSRSGTILDFGGRSVSAPALEPIQNDIRHGVHTYEILGASNEFIAADKRIHEELNAMRKQAGPAP